MSSILDALRKLDEQKSARKPGGVDLARVMGKKVASPTGGIRLRPWHLVLALVLVAVASVMATLLVTKRKPAAITQMSVVAPGEAAPAQGPAPAPLPVPPPAAGTIVEAPLYLRKSPATPREKGGVAIPAPAPTATVVAGRGKVAAPTAPVSIVPSPGAAQPVSATPETTEKEPAVISSPRPPVPTLQVTGIGWQKEAAARYAVINGTAVGEGGSVEGAKVVEILPDRVRLLNDGQLKDIMMGK